MNAPATGRTQAKQDDMEGAPMAANREAANREAANRDTHVHRSDRDMSNRDTHVGELG